MTIPGCASIHFADASRNMEPEPLPPGWKYEWSGGHYRIVPDPKPGAIIPCGESATTHDVTGLTK